MARAVDLLRDLRARGLDIRPEGDNALALYPRTLLTDADRAAIRQLKADLLALLAEEDAEGRRGTDEALAPFADLLDRAACGELVAAVRAAGHDRLHLAPHLSTEEPDRCALRHAGILRCILTDPDRRDMPLWIGVIGDCLETLRLITDAVSALARRA